MKKVGGMSDVLVADPVSGMRQRVKPMEVCEVMYACGFFEWLQGNPVRPPGDTFEQTLDFYSEHGEWPIIVTGLPELKDG